MKRNKRVISQTVRPIESQDGHSQCLHHWERTFYCELIIYWFGDLLIYCYINVAYLLPRQYACVYCYINSTYLFAQQYGSVYYYIKFKMHNIKA